jgi:RNA polymerase sigma-70 factor (ECF subfamily)
MLVPDAQDVPRMDGERLARCVQMLRERERSVIVMSFYDERTSEESARSLGLSEANVRVIRHRAIRQLRACMEPAS